MPTPRGRGLSKFMWRSADHYVFRTMYTSTLRTTFVFNVNNVVSYFFKMLVVALNYRH